MTDPTSRFTPRVAAVLSDFSAAGLDTIRDRLGLSADYSDGLLSVVSQLMAFDLGHRGLTTGRTSTVTPRPGSASRVERRGEGGATLRYLLDTATPELLLAASNPVGYRRSTRTLVVPDRAYVYLSSLSNDEALELWDATVYLLGVYQRAVLVTLGYRVFHAFYLDPVEASDLDYERAYGPDPSGVLQAMALPDGYEIRYLIGHFFDVCRGGVAYHYDVVTDRLTAVGEFSDDGSGRRLVRYPTPEPVPAPYRPQ